MLVNEVVDDFDGLRTGLALDDAVLDSDGEIIRAAPHVDVRRVVVEGIDEIWMPWIINIDPMRLIVVLFCGCKDTKLSANLLCFKRKKCEKGAFLLCFTRLFVPLHVESYVCGTENICLWY